MKLACEDKEDTCMKVYGWDQSLHENCTKAWMTPVRGCLRLKIVSVMGPRVVYLNRAQVTTFVFQEALREGGEPGKMAYNCMQDCQKFADCNCQMTKPRLGILV